VDGLVLAGGASSRFGGQDKTAQRVAGRTLLGRAVQALADGGAGTVVVVGPRLPADVAITCRLVLTREDPPGAGPVAGLQAGLAHVAADEVVVLAADLPGVHGGVVSDLHAALLAAAGRDAAGRDGAGRDGAGRDGAGRDGAGRDGAGRDGAGRDGAGRDGAGLHGTTMVPDAVVAVDTDGRAQWLSGAYRSDALREAVRSVLDGGARTDGRGPSLKTVVGRLQWTGLPAAPSWGRLVDVDTPQDLTRARLDDWAVALLDELDLSGPLGDLPAPSLVELVLDLAKDAAHTVARPAAPVTTFALGLAAGLEAARTPGQPVDLVALRARIDVMIQAYDEGEAPSRDAASDPDAAPTP